MATPRATIPELPEQTAAVDTDLLVVQNGATTKKMTVGRLTTASTSAVDAHIADAIGAHAASAISAIPSAAPFDGTDVQTQLSQSANAIASINAAVSTNTTGLANHLADTSDAHDASAVSVVAASGIVATDVQGALVELQGEITTAQTGATTANTNLTAHLNDTSDAHDASAISVLPAGNLNSTDVQAALAELQVDIDNIELIPGPPGDTGMPGPQGDWASAQPIESQSGAFTVTAADAGKLKRCTSALVITLPSGALTVGQRVDFVGISGTLQWVLGSGATWDVPPTPAPSTRATGSFATAIKMGATQWALTGDLA